MADASITLTAVDKTAAAIESAKKNIQGVTDSATSAAAAFLGFSTAVGALAAAWAAIVANTRAVDAFNDLRDTTGASIEKISALDRVARETGGSFDSVATTLVKFNGVLNKSGDDTKQAGEIFKNLGLDVDALKQMDPADALLKTAQAFQKFEIDGNAGRAMQVLFSKSVAEVAPFLKDLAEKGALVGTVTKQGAQEAEDFNKALYRMKANSQDAARYLSIDLVTGINAAAKAWRESGLIGAIQTLLTGDDEFKNNKQLVTLTEQLLQAENNLSRSRSRDAQFGDKSQETAANERRVKGLKDELKTVQAYKALIDGAIVPEAVKPKLPDSAPPKKAKAADLAADNFINQLITEYSNLNGQLTKTDEVTRKLDTATEKFTATQRARALSLADLIDKERVKKVVLAEQNKELERYGAASEAAEEAYSKSVLALITSTQAQQFEISLIGKTAEEVDRLRFERELSLRVVEAESQVLESRNRGLIDEIEARQKLQAINRFAGEARGGRAELVAQTEARLRDPTAGYKEAFLDYEKVVGRVAVSTKSLMNDAFKGMEDALVSFIKTGKLDFKSLADSIISNLIRIQVQQSITLPLSRALNGLGGLSRFGGSSSDPSAANYVNSFDAASDASGGGLLATLKGFFSFDGGGYTGDGMRTGGLDGKGGFMAMMHPQETVIDHSKGQGMGGFAPSTTINVSGGMASAEVYKTVRLALSENNRQWSEQLKRQGVLQ